jgi:Do/DeqQ family serine protease
MLVEIYKNEDQSSFHPSSTRITVSGSNNYLTITSNSSRNISNLRLFVFASIAIITFSLFLSSVALSYELKKDNGKPALNSKEVKELASLSNGLADLADATKEALVYISVSKTMKRPRGYIDPFEFFFGPGQRRPQSPQKKQGLGSGFFIDMKKGYIMTNNHVVEGADEIEVKLSNGKSYDAKIVGRDQNTDIAILQIKDNTYLKKGVRSLVLSQREARVGEFSVALGAPFGLEASISFGVVSALGRNNLKITKLGNFIQTDAAINPGNSGGPLIDMQGKVIGINTAIYSKSGGYNGIGFAVPSKMARNVAEKLITHGKIRRGFIGVGLQELTPEIAEGLGLKADQSGALVKQIEPNGPALKAGLKPGDVIIKVDGSKIDGDQALILAIGTKSPGEKVKVTIIRNGREKNKTLKISSWPGEELVSDNSPIKKDPNNSFGLHVSEISEQLKGSYGFNTEDGVVVTSVTPGSSSENAGIIKGDVIVAINSQTIKNIKSFNKAVKGKKKLLLRIQRGSEFLFVAVSKE